MKSILQYNVILLTLLFSVQVFSENAKVIDLFESFNVENSGSPFSFDHAERVLKERVIGKGTYRSQIKNVMRESLVRLSVSDTPIVLKVDNVIRKSNTRIAFSAATDGKTDLLYWSENDGQVVGSLHHKGKLYKLRPGSKGETLLIEVSDKSLIDHDEQYYRTAHQMQGLADNPSDNSVNHDYSEKGNTPYNYRASGDEFTVIVAYTSGFRSAAGNIGAYMDLLELETNTSYSNSNVNTRVKIVHAYQTSYQDSGNFYTDRNYFSNSNNSETKKLYDLRDTHNADIMMILTGNSYSFCGLARAIGATAGTALGLARESCATGYYSFGHEIGHLFGARHIIYTDSSTTPFSYGHGYCNTTASTWRTVMAYNCPYRTGGPRIQQWSNPDVYINNQPTGTVHVENNAKVLNVRAETVANFR